KQGSEDQGNGKPQQGQKSEQSSQQPGKGAQGDPQPSNNNAESQSGGGRATNPPGDDRLRSGPTGGHAGGKLPDGPDGTIPAPAPQPKRADPQGPAVQRSSKASDLQLEDLRKKINKDVLKEANMTEQEYQEFLKAYERMLKNKSAATDEKEKLAGPQQGN